ncbi:adenylate/guanylate cyclase domain-containing protein [Microvirga tunisiensis]|uniref:Adenylate/guanylate cyclase domain-containing protein n=1 Tax=Microvirga tunisiensis TaxID=2108360 RepID=A0A5N7MIE1_9HYPH|nr:adenylate/guanylate cyclase domain-containing protein [Microvirga tunisiensis]MPR08575.1 adenylate/guanylate cyclase domain-containing protein [Microvirga tunisiensis]MPR26841.1 adenylate/guanylate cyclase domain-containing protein [Microvirga tunisiensis]
MSDVANRIIGFVSSALQALRSLWSPGRPQDRLKASIRQAELEGLQFAFYARLTAIIIVSIWLIWLVPWPRDLYYGAYAFGFFILGYLPYRLRHHPHGEAIKLGFIVLDVALVSAAILLPPPASLGNEWPIQTRLRGQEFLYVLLLLAEAALTYSPRRVLWTGVSILVIWSIGVFSIYSQPDTLRFNDAAAEGALTSAAVLDLSFKPAFVGLTAWYTQLVATSLFTLLITLAVWRSRRALLNQVEAEVVRADLSRYVSPDVAEALARRGGTAFGEPATRTVAVLFADIVGFTRLTEPLSPERTFALLRSFQERSSAIVFKHGGTLDKYLGDGFMATFGSVGLQRDAPARALACAFDLQQEIGRWSRKRSGRGADPLRVSVGIHCGPVTVGNLGGRERVEFTVVGDVVNVASRLEEITRAVGGSIIASEDCIRAAADPEWLTRFQSSREIQLRGRQKNILVHIAA